MICPLCGNMTTKKAGLWKKTYSIYIWENRFIGHEIDAILCVMKLRGVSKFCVTPGLFTNSWSSVLMLASDNKLPGAKQKKLTLSAGSLQNIKITKVKATLSAMICSRTQQWNWKMKQASRGLFSFSKVCINVWKRTF